jgi:hypothetical protein
MGERFALFYWLDGEQLGGWSDVRGFFDSSEDARTYLHSIDQTWSKAHCVNLQSEYIVWEEYNPNEDGS